MAATGAPDLAAHVPVTQMALLTVAVLFCSFVLRRLMQNNLGGSKPPIYEGIPFIGGILKFLKVCNTSIHNSNYVYVRPSVFDPIMISLQRSAALTRYFEA